MADIEFQLEGNAPQWYEQENVPKIGRPTAKLTFEHVPLYAGEQVLDVACGTGIVVRVAGSAV